jgi:hypothetical protein
MLEEAGTSEQEKDLLLDQVRRGEQLGKRKVATLVTRAMEKPPNCRDVRLAKKYLAEDSFCSLYISPEFLQQALAMEQVLRSVSEKDVIGLTCMAANGSDPKELVG